MDVALDLALNSLARPPVAQGAPGVVPAAPRRHAQVRREPAQALPGHLQLQLGHAGLARAVAGAGATSSLHWVDAGRQGLPRRQPAHEAVPVLGVADRRGPRGRPRRGLPRRGVHPPRGDAPAGEDRLHPVLHVLHLEELPLGADASTSTSSPTGRSASTSGPTSSPTRRTSSTPTSQHGGPPAFYTRLVLAGTLSPTLRHLLGLRVTTRTCRCARAPRSTWTPRSTRSSSARSTARCCRSSAASTRSAARTRRCSTSSNVAFLDTYNEALIAYVKQSPGNTVICVVNIDPHHAQEGAGVVPAHLGLPPAFAVDDLLSGEHFDWRIGANYVRARARARQAHVLRVDAQ